LYNKTTNSGFLCKGKIMSLQTTILRGNIYASFLVYASLTPAQVAGSTTVTQTFTIPGLQVNDCINVSLNGAQTTSISITSAWVSAANTLSIQFVNASGSAVTPVAGTYILACDRLEGTILPTNAA
jgi:hypothetical protein